MSFAIRPVLRPTLRAVPRTRSFVSAVLLGRPLEQLTVSDLKKEARSRGLSVTGNKASLLGRIQDHEKSLSSSAPSRQAAIEESSTGGVAPGIPPEQTPSTSSAEHFNLVIPDADYDQPETPVQIPFVPDFWGSGSAQKQDIVEEQVLPKIVVIAGAESGAETAASGLNLVDDIDSEAQSTPERPFEYGKGGLLDDMTEDIGLPYPREIRKAFWRFFS